MYNLAGYLITNGYPNGFWGWGGEDNAQFLRCVACRLTLERVSGCDFDDLEEGVDTVDEKLRRLDAMGARCGSKDKRRLLKENARDGGWRRDGLNSSAFQVVSQVVRGGGEDDEEEEINPEGQGHFASAPSSYHHHQHVIHVVIRLRASIDDELTCVECGVSKPQSGFASHQYRRAMFWVKRGGGGGGGGGNIDDDGTGSGAGAGQGEEGEEGVGSATNNRESKTQGWKHGARCLLCVAKDPRVVEDRRCKERNKTDPERVTCASCGEAFPSRTKLFKHLETSGHGA